MRVLFVTSEAHPLAKSGGLADVSGALPAALARYGLDVRLLLPAYPCALAALKNPQIEAHLAPMLGVEGGALISGHLPGSRTPVWLVHAPSLYSRPGGLYQSSTGEDWTDNALRFAYLSKVGALIANGFVGWKPDIVHANDWHTGLLPLFLQIEGARAPAVFTIHNLAFQGNFSREAATELGIPDNIFSPDGIEFYGQVSFLKAGIRFCQALTTVSPTYAKEVLTPEFGCGLDGVIRSRKHDFFGILNGIDDTCWNPATDPYIARPFNYRDIGGKRLCKIALQSECNLDVDHDAPLIGFVSRITHQKMADIVADALPAIAQMGAQFVLLGNGDPHLEDRLKQLGEAFPNLAIRVGYDEPFAHRLQAGADILLAPARYEPCGLTQIYAMQYGTIPVVRRTGGLADTIVDVSPTTLSDRTATGFAFENVDTGNLLHAVERALALYREPLAWRRLQLEGMSQDFSWNSSAARYVALYERISGSSPISSQKQFEPQRKTAATF